MFFCFLEHADLMTCSRARVFSTWTDEEPGYTSKDAWPAAHMVLQIHAFCCWSGLFDRWRPSSHTCSFDPYTPSKQCWPDREFLCKSNLNFVWFSTPSTCDNFDADGCGSCGSKNNPSQDPHDPPGYVRDILFGAPLPDWETKREKMATYAGRATLHWAVFQYFVTACFPRSCCYLRVRQ